MSDQVQVKEPIRAWFERKTKRIRKAILWFSVVSVIGAIVAFFFMPPRAIETLQVFNGAFVIPVGCAIWMLSFIFLFLLPSREAGFRSQEGIDEAREILSRAVDEKVGPAMDAIHQVAGKVDNYIKAGLVEDFQKSVHQRIVPAADCVNRVFQRVEASIVNSKILDEIRDAASAMAALCRKYEKGGLPDAAELSKFVAEARPVVAMLGTVQKRFEKDFGEDFIRDLRSAVSTVREIGAVPPPVPRPQVARPVAPAPAPAAATPPQQSPAPSAPVLQVLPPARAAAAPKRREPDLARALKVISNKKVGAT